MHLALHMYDDSDEILKMASQLGATHFLAFTRLPDPNGYFEFIDLLRFRKKVESFGLQLGGVVVPRERGSAIHAGPDGCRAGAAQRPGRGVAGLGRRAARPAVRRGG